MNPEELMTRRVLWQPRIGDPVGPGEEEYGPGEEVPARIIEKRKRLDADRFAERTIWVPVRFNVQTLDLLDGSEVLEVKTPEDTAGVGLVRFCHVR